MTIKYLQAVGLMVIFLLVSIITAPIRCYFCRTEIKKDIKYGLIIWIALTVVLLIALAVSDLIG